MDEPAPALTPGGTPVGEVIPGPLLMTAAQAAARLGVSITTVRRATRAGALPYRRIGEWGIRYTEEDLQEWVAVIATRRHRPRRAPAPSLDHTTVKRADIPP